jgi:hypothetical protein
MTDVREGEAVIPVQAAHQPLEASHETALRRAYELVEAAQDRDVAEQIDGLDEQARAAGWAEVRLLAHFARSLAARKAGLDDTEHVQAMLDTAGCLADPALLALALATSAQRTADARLVQAPGASGAEQVTGTAPATSRTRLCLELSSSSTRTGRVLPGSDHRPIEISSRHRLTILRPRSR